MKLTSVAMAIPSLPVAIVLAAYLDASIWNPDHCHLHHRLAVYSPDCPFQDTGIKGTSLH